MNPDTQTRSIHFLFQNKSVKGLLLAVSVFLSLPVSLFSDSYLCLHYQPTLISGCVDPSWMTALNLAVENSLIFGKEFVFNYGPLGFLSTRTGVGISPVYLVLFDIFIAANVGFILARIWKDFNGITVAIISVLICYLLPAHSITFILPIIILFWLNVALEEDSPKYFIVPSIAAPLAFFIKINTGFLAVFLFYLFLTASLFFRGSARRAKLALGVVSPVFLYILANCLNVDIPQYLISGFDLISFYSEAMGFMVWPPTVYTVFAFAASILSLPAYVLLFVGRQRDAAARISVFSWGLLLFFLFKQSMVRQDTEHVINFFYFAPIIWLLTIYFVRPGSGKVNSLVLTAALVTMVVGIGALRYFVPPSFFNPANRLDYLAALLGYENNRKKEAVTRENFEVPAEVKNIVGASSVDIIPWNVDLIYFNGLNYNPRPIHQSYTAFSPRFIELNKAKYEGSTAPEFVIFSTDAIDRRYGFFDDSGVRIATIENYSVKTRFNLYGTEYLLLARENGRRKVTFDVPNTTTFRLGEDYELPDPNKSYYMKVKIAYSLFGQFSRLVFQPLPLKLHLDLSDGGQREFRVVPSMLASGVIFNPLIETTGDYESLIEGNINNARTIRRFRLLPEYEGALESLNAMTYAEPFKIEISEMNIVPAK